jgi:hypothetical protein
MNDKKDYIMFRGKPLVRENNMLVYGDMSDKYILFLLILTNKVVDKNKNVEIPDKILIQILSTDTSKPAHERMEKQFEKNGLFEAMDIGLIWLDKLNK